MSKRKTAPTKAAHLGLRWVDVESMPAESARPGEVIQMPKVSDPPKFEFLTLDGERRPKLSDEERDELIARWEQKTLTPDDVRLLRADHERALCKYGEHPEQAKRQSASASIQLVKVFHYELADYALNSRGGKQRGGFNSSGVAESSEKPAREQVVQAIKREVGNGTPKREIARRVREGGINLSLRQIRNIGQQLGLLESRRTKGKR